jgi:O-methyltransferase involved in polyketide biosynthesis
MSASIGTSRQPGPTGARAPLHLQGVQQTLAIPLYAKAQDYRSKHPILNDRGASQLADRIDLDPEASRSRAGRLLVLRARQLDEWVREFIGRRPDGLVLNLGCGLDTRISRIDPPSSVGWFDVDFPEVIELRSAYFDPRDGYRMLGSSITQPEWLAQIPRHRPVMVVADGVLAYLSEDEVRTLLNRLTDNFHEGQVVFDVLNLHAIRTSNARTGRRIGAPLRWGVDDLREINALDPKLRRTAALPLLGTQFTPLAYRMLNAILAPFPRMRNMMRVVRYEF